MQLPDAQSQARELRQAGFFVATYQEDWSPASANGLCRLSLQENEGLHPTKACAPISHIAFHPAEFLVGSLPEVIEQLCDYRERRKGLGRAVFPSVNEVVQLIAKADTRPDPFQTVCRDLVLRDGILCGRACVDWTGEYAGVGKIPWESEDSQKRIKIEVTPVFWLLK